MLFPLYLFKGAQIVKTANTKTRNKNVTCIDNVTEEGLKEWPPTAEKAVVESVTKTAHDWKVLGSNPFITGIPNGSGVIATQVRLIHPAWFFLDASNNCWTKCVSGSLAKQCFSFTESLNPNVWRHTLRAHGVVAVQLWTKRRRTWEQNIFQNFPNK